MASPKRRAHVPRSRLVGGPALAIVIAAAMAGCTSSSSASSSSASSSSASSTTTGTGAAVSPLTTAQARAIFDGYVATTAKAARANDAALALSVVTGVQQDTLAATLKGSGTVIRGEPSAGRSYGAFSGNPDYAPYTYGKPAIDLPEPAGYPRFFVVDVTRALTGSTPADGFVTLISGAKVPVDGRVLMVFEQASATAAWQLASTSFVPAGVTVPRLATDRNGDTPQVPLSATTLLARPDATGPLQAAVVDDGPASAAARAVAAGPLTTGMYQGAREHVEGLSAPRGDVYQWDLEGTPYPVFALRTASGGALVLYAMYLNNTVAVPGVVNKASPIRPGLPIEVPPNFLPLLPKATAAPRESLETQQVLSFAAIDPPAGSAKVAVIDPPAGSAKVAVIAIGGGPNYATAS